MSSEISISLFLSVCPASFLPGFSDTPTSLLLLSLCCLGCVSVSPREEGCAAKEKCSGSGELGP